MVDGSFANVRFTGPRKSVGISDEGSYAVIADGAAFLYLHASFARLKEGDIIRVSGIYSSDNDVSFKGSMNYPLAINGVVDPNMKSVVLECYPESSVGKLHGLFIRICGGIPVNSDLKTDGVVVIPLRAVAD